jgi:pilus assembly protein CpaB
MKTAASQGLSALRQFLARGRQVALALGALGFGLLAVLGANAYIQERVELERSRLAGEHERVEVLVARRPLQQGEVLGPETLAVRTLPRNLLPGGALPPSRIDALQGLKLQWPLQAGEPVLSSAVFAAEAKGLSSRLRSGGRAMTIAVDETNAISGLLQPGDRIDLLLSWRPTSVAGVSQPEITRSVMQDVVVIATGRQARALLQEEGVGRSFSAITVEVDPDQAQRLVVAQRSGRLTAVLRHPQDREAIDERPLDVHDLMGGTRPSAGGVSALVNAMTGAASARHGVDSRPSRSVSPSQSTVHPPASAARESTASSDPSRSDAPDRRVELIIGGRGPIAGPGDGSWATPERSATGPNSSTPKPLAMLPSEVPAGGLPQGSLQGSLQSPPSGAALGSASATQAQIPAVAPTVPLLR